MPKPALFMILGCALAAGSCGWQPGVYPPPVQRASEPGRDPDVLSSYIKIEDPRVADYVVKDIVPDSGVFRWATVAPEFRLGVPTNQGLKLMLDFAIVEATFKDTGPVTVSCFVNGHKLTEARYTKAERYQLKYPVPPEWVDPEHMVRVSFSASPRWVSPLDGVELSFVIYGAGFVQ